MTATVVEELRSFSKNIKGRWTEDEAREWGEDLRLYSKKLRVQDTLTSTEKERLGVVREASNEVIRALAKGLRPDISNLQMALSTLISEIEARSVGGDGYPMRK